MFKVIKTYFPSFLSILFLFFYSFTIVTVSMYEYFLNDMNSIFIVGLIIIFLFFIEWIYFIIKAITNKDGINKPLWSVLIYLFNVFIIPYYNFKYVMKISNVKLNTIVFGVLAGVSCVIGAFVPGVLAGSRDSAPLILYSDDFKLEFVFNGYYEEKESNNYDVYVEDSYRNIISGVIIYDKNDSKNITSENILKVRKQGVLNVIPNAETESLGVENYDDKKITTNIYVEPGGTNKLIVMVSTIEFNNSSYIVNFVQFMKKKNYEKFKDSLKTNLYNVRLIEEVK